MAVSKSQQFFEDLWYNSPPWWLWFLLPLQWLLRLVVWLRRALYHTHLLKSYHAGVPTIVIGNINVGGTGKTPLAIYLLKLLQQEGYKPGLVTRGYGGQSDTYPLRVTDNSNPQQVGDEPFLIYLNTKAMIAVDPNRSRAAKLLVKEGCDILLCDDGLQHYALQRDIEIAVVDSQRMFGNQWLLPMGPLREPVSRLKQCDLQVYNGKTMLLQPKPIKNVVSWSIISQQQQALLKSKNLNAVAAIGNPQRFFNTIKALGYRVIEKTFPDHHQFTKDDFVDGDGPVIMTEKDAVKCREVAKEHFYFLPVEAELDKEITQKLLTLIRKVKDESQVT